MRIRNFRIYLIAQFISQIGVWVQRIAQDWLVLDITGNATDVGITTALQFLPILMFGLYAAVLADRYPKRWLLVGTQVLAGSMAAILAVLVLTDSVQVWHIYGVAFGLGVATAFDNPVRQAFVHEMVGPSQVRNAVSLNASVFQLGALVGPLASGGLISLIGNGWSFAVNAASYVAVVIGLIMIRESELHYGDSRANRDAKLKEGLVYVFRRKEIFATTMLATSFAIFTANLPVTLAAYAKIVFNSGAGGYGLLSAAIALGSVMGALISARARTNRLRGQVGYAVGLGLAAVLCSALPIQWMFWTALVLWGTMSMLFFTSSSAMVQLATADSMRGRVMGIYMLIFWGAGAIGGPGIGYLAQNVSPRFAMFLTGSVPLIATFFIGLWLARTGRLRMRFQRGGDRYRYRFEIEPKPVPRHRRPTDRGQSAPVRTAHLESPRVADAVSDNAAYRPGARYAARTDGLDRPVV